MKKTIAILPILIAALFSCSKSSSSADSPATPAAETPVAFTISATNNSVSLTNGFAVTATLSSAMPSSKGIKVETTLLDQSTNANITQNAAVSSVVAANNLQLINLPQQHWCTATVKVSSVATPSNSASQSFTVVYK